MSSPVTFWREFLDQKGLDPGLRYLECTMFGEPEHADRLLDLVLAGKKRATTSSLRYYQVTGGRPPQPGDYSIVTNGAGKPRCVIQTRSVTRLSFSQMTYEICRREGEDDDLATWKAGHKAYFEREGSRCGYAFSPDMPLLFEDFELVYVAG